MFLTGLAHFLRFQELVLTTAVKVSERKSRTIKKWNNLGTGTNRNLIGPEPWFWFPNRESTKKWNSSETGTEN